MNNRWDDQAARKAVERWGEEFGHEVALRLYTARLLGVDADLVLHGGGNVSVKCAYRTPLGDEVNAIRVKRSGGSLDTLEPCEFPALELEPLRLLRSLDALDDEAMVNEIRRALFDASAPTTSIETLVHAFLPHRYVDHSHADAVLAITNLGNGSDLIRDALGQHVAILDYVRPGFDLAKAVADCVDETPDVEGIVLMNHGLITIGDDARTAYERHISIVDACERFIADRAKPRPPASPNATKETAAELVGRAAPILRGLLAQPTHDEDQPYRRSIFEWRGDKQVLQWLDCPDAAIWATSGPLTGDHLIHTRPKAMFVSSPKWLNDDELRAQLTESVAAFRTDYESYVTEHGATPAEVDSSPRVVWLPGAGMLCWGPSKQAACITADLAEHTLSVKAQAWALGDYAFLSADHLFDMEFRKQQRDKLNPGDAHALAGQVVAISGGAGAIGVAIGHACASAGAHIAIADVNEERVAAAVAGLEERHGRGTAFGLHMDVTSDDSVAEGYAKIVQQFGGVDVLVPNAGVAHVAAIDELTTEDFQRVFDINATGYLRFMREGIRVLKAQKLGGHIIINASKNVFGPGKDFGAYSASKAAGHQLGKVAAIELAPFGIRVNMINADAVFGDESTPSGLWAKIGPDRAKSRNLKPEDLPEYYRDRNLLKARVRGHHVGNAVVFFASNATPTTGATLPVDGGVVEAFPR